MRQWRNGAGNAPRHYAGTRSASGCALSRTRSLTAAAVAVAMMATIAVTSPIPAYNAKAEELADGKTCTPASVGLGDDMSVTGTDTGVATYVGGDMYVGGKPSDASALNNAAGPTGTYAVEAEGLTVVNGSLAMNPQKEAWKLWNTGSAGGKSYVSRGFRWGVVGFGSQFRPADGKTVLAVGGNTGTSVMYSKVGAWTAPGWLGKTSSSDTTDHGYKASLAGAPTQVWGKTGVDSVRGLSGSDITTSQPPVLGIDSSLVAWNQDGLSNVNGTDYSAYKSKISKLSEDLNTGTKLPATGTVDEGNAPSAGDSYTIYKYDYQKNKGKGNSFTFYDKLEKEKLITFTSTDTSKSMQVFNLPASSLNLIGTDYTGIDFKFVNVPDNASVVVNVTGANGQTIDFHNGWRFWWNNDNIANDFVTAASGDTTQAAKNTNYAKRAQQIMWNFADASNVVIRGGQATGWIQVTDHNTNTSTNHGAWGSAHDMRATDDPSAAWMGSILVPNGSLQSHVSTNGRVWVGGDFEMLNNETVKRVAGQSTDGHNVGDEFVNESGEKTTSILDMDQERHNLPWNGSYSTSCAAIAWNKVDDTAEHKALGGTSWTVYGKKEDAVHGTNALATIADGGWNDDADAEGSFQLGNLAKNGTYFLKESGTAEGYAQNTNIYQINTGSSTTEAATNISNVFDSAGGAISTDADKLLTDGKIINKKTGSAIEWQKVDGTDNSTLLAGSTWTLSKMNGDTASEEWAITDDQSGTEVKSVKIFDANSNEVVSASFTNSTAQRFHAVAYDQNGTPIDNAKLTWSSADSAVAAVSENGLVTPTGNGNTTITVKSADGKVTASFTVEVSGVTVETSVSINGYTDGQEISLEKGKTLKLTASNTVEWSTSSAANVSLSTITGTSVTLTANQVTSSPVTITATRTSKSVTLKVNVTKPQATTTTVFFKMQDDFNQNNGQKLFLEWKTANGSWPSDTGDQPNRKEMTVASGCNGYVSYTINEVMPTSASFRIRRDKANWTTPQSFYRPDANSGFAFNGGDIVTLNTATEILGTAPSGCAVISTAAYSSRRVTSRSGEHRAVSAVLRAQGSVLNAVNETVSTKVDEDTAAGKFKVSDLANGTYQLQETKAPNGYDLSNTVYTIIITGGKVTWNSDVTDSKIANTRKTGSVTWTKVSSDINNSDPLSGSEWTLKQTKTFSWADGAAKYTVVTSEATLGTVTDCVDGQNGVAKCSAQTGEYVDLDGASGKFKISGLVWGEYQLIESKAPDGYDLDTTPHTFRIGPLEGDNIAGNWYANTDFNIKGTSAYNEQTTFTVNGGNIKNKPGVILPGTGGAGDYWIYAAALVAALIGVVAAGMALKVRRRQ
ncbi:SpaA isopeptide-forming pilin-related protein [Bifidobacterium adolescentis]|jgi:choice-of-anchor A domain-containing protein|uniref:SpaA isopeptide-forming pilin-related protein n=1 Tax=Bifidobacterium adolescentis TaxID=1680 RepID=UPI0011CAA773|nr:SpaA isopeptide-forming pilin-related protein [Bifidobacterium adolescentis]